MVVEHAADLVEVEIDHGRPTDPAAHEMEHDLHGTESLRDGSDGGTGRLGIGEVGDRGNPSVRGKTQLRPQGRQAVAVRADETQPGAIGREGGGRDAPEPTGRTGDEHDPVRVGGHGADPDRVRAGAGGPCAGAA